MIGVPYALLFRAAGDTFRSVGECEYLGGVMYCVSGVAGGVALGSRPSSDRCVGVNGISVSSSFVLIKGSRAIVML